VVWKILLLPYWWKCLKTTIFWWSEWFFTNLCFDFPSNTWGQIIAAGEQSSLGGTRNLPECSNLNISKCTKIFSLFSHKIKLVSTKKVFTKIQYQHNFEVTRIISNLPEFISSCGRVSVPLVFYAYGAGGVFILNKRSLQCFYAKNKAAQ